MKPCILINATDGERLIRTLLPGTFVVIATTGQVRIVGETVDYIYRPEDERSFV